MTETTTILNPDGNKLSFKCGTKLPASTKRCSCCRIEKSRDQSHKRKERGRQDGLQLPTMQDVPSQPYKKVA